LRKGLERYFPPAFVWRRKHGFSVPLARWFQGELSGYIGDRFLTGDALVRRIVDRGVLERLIEQHREGVRDWSSALWALLMFDYWCRGYGVRAENIAGA
jgi:asparagine synthase (glutamine-hydrolysing)